MEIVVYYDLYGLNTHGGTSILAPFFHEVSDEEKGL